MLITIDAQVEELHAVVDHIAMRTAALQQPLLTQIQQQLTKLQQQGMTEMATLADIQAAVAAEKTVEDSAITLLTQIHQALVDALAANDPAAVQAVVDQLAANTTALAAAVSANTAP